MVKKLMENSCSTIIFGSDWPGMRWIRRNMEAIGKLPLSAEGVERILGGNAARLLRI